MKTQVFDSELRVMEVLWQNGDTTAKELAQILGEQIEWSKTTTYTVIKKCVDKGYIERQGTDFLCHALITKEKVQELKAQELVDKMFDGQSDLLVASLIINKKMSLEQLIDLKMLLENFTM